MSDDHQGGFFLWVRLITKGILHDRVARRTVLFWLTAAVLAQLALGVFALDAWLMERPLAFLLFWGLCFWLTLTAALLALYDMLVVRREAVAERQALKRRVFGAGDKEEKP